MRLGGGPPTRDERGVREGHNISYATNIKIDPMMLLAVDSHRMSGTDKIDPMMFLVQTG